MERLRKTMRVDCVIIAQVNQPEANAFYYSGIEEPFLLYVTKEKTVAFTTDAESRLNQFDKVHPWKNAKGFYKSFFKKNKIKTVGLDFSTEANRVGFRLLSSKGSKVKVENYAGKLDEVRALKDEQEKKLIRKAQDVTKKCVEEAKAYGLEGRTENEIAGFLELACRKKGFALNSFPPIIATGEKTAIPHTIPSDEKIHELALMDCGATCKNYHADFTTTEYSGKTKEVADAMEAVWESKKAAERKAKIGASGKMVSKTAEKVIAEYGFGKYSFKKNGLSLGHGVGLKVHDGFRVDNVKLQKGMVFSIEPGIYVPKRFGIRFEDIVFL
ncbi:MAG: Xaa-Pro peptidase family protein [Candidatus Micrarchaeota archaeon]